MTCSHSPACPGRNDRDAAAAAIVDNHCEQGWYRLCNGLILFDDGGCLHCGTAGSAGQGSVRAA